MQKISYQLKQDHERRREPFVPEGKLPFGELRSDHLFLMDYSDGRWHYPRIVPYGPYPKWPGANHYGQFIFEGSKVFLREDGELYTFRLEENAARQNHSSRLACIPKIPEEDQIKAIQTLADIDRLWFPLDNKSNPLDGASLYVRPYIEATEDFLGVRPSKEYLYGVFLSPSGPYYPEGFYSSVTFYLTNKFKRVAPKGVGSGKFAGNYGASLLAGGAAHEVDAKQVLYTDVNNEFLEEAGAMNHYHVTSDGEIIIPEFTDTILRSITSCSFLSLEDRLGHPVIQRKIKVKDFLKDLKEGGITEAGGLGTAAVVSPIGRYIQDIDDELPPEITVGTGEIGPVSRKMYELLTGIQTGKIDPPDPGWLKKVEREWSP